MKSHGSNNASSRRSLDSRVLEVSKAVALICCLCSSIVPGFGSNTGLLWSEEEAAYKKSDFSAVVVKGKKLLAVQPDNVTARYYLAGALLKLNRAQEAEKEYALCKQQCTDPQMNRFLDQALYSLNPRKYPPPPSGATPTQQMQSVPPTRRQGRSASGNQKDTSNQAELAQLKAQSDKEIQFLRSLTDKEIAKAKQEAASATASVSRDRLNRADYDQNKSRAEEACRTKVRALEDDFSRRKTAAMLEYQRQSGMLGR